MKKRGEEKTLRWQRFELLSVVSLGLLLLGIFLINSSLFPNVFDREGDFATAYFASELNTQEINLLVEESQRFNILVEESFLLTSLRLSGNIEGEGPLQIFLETPSSERYLVYENIAEKTNGDIITGFATRDEPIAFTLAPSSQIDSTIDIEEDEFVVANSFYQQCINTCFLSLLFDTSQEYSLLVLMGEETKVAITQITYTIE